MNFEPQRFFIGVIDFFSVLLPGALLTYLLMDDAGPHVLGDRYHELESAELWVVFFFSSYLLGHFVFLVGSWLLDEPVYDRIRAGTYQGQIKRLADGRNLSSGVARRLARHLIKSRSDNAVRQAETLRDHYLAPFGGKSVLNAFQWSKARLTLEKPEALATVQRFEADSKFFRSLVVVLGFLIPWAVYDGRFAIAAVGLAFLVLAFWRYVEQRLKSTDQAYWYVITMEGSRGDAGAKVSNDHSEGRSHAGGVVRRDVGGRAEFLLVQATDASTEWVLPKGHIEVGETMPETAVREVREETGVWARVKEKLAVSQFSAPNGEVHAQFYLMESVHEEPSPENRNPCWFSLEQAIKQATHPETKTLLRLAGERTCTRH